MLVSGEPSRPPSPLSRPPNKGGRSVDGDIGGRSGGVVGKEGTAVHSGALELVKGGSSGDKVFKLDVVVALRDALDDEIDLTLR